MKRIVVSTMAATVAAGVAVAGVFSIVHKHGTPTMRQSSATTSAAANAGVANINTGTPSQNQIASPFNDVNNQTQPAVASGPSSDNSGATSTQRNTLPNQPGSNPASATSGPATQSATQSAGQTFSGTDNHTTQNSGPAPASIHLTYKGIDGLGYDQDPTAPLEVNERFGERLVFTIRDTNGNPIPGIHFTRNLQQ